MGFSVRPNWDVDLRFLWDGNVRLLIALLQLFSLFRLQKHWNAPKNVHYHLIILTWLVSWPRHPSVWVGHRHVPAGKPSEPYHSLLLHFSSVHKPGLSQREMWGRQDYAGRDEQCLHRNKSNFKSHQFVRLLQILDWMSKMFQWIVLPPRSYF